MRIKYERKVLDFRKFHNIKSEFLKLLILRKHSSGMMEHILSPNIWLLNLCIAEIEILKASYILFLFNFNCNFIVTVSTNKQKVFSKYLVWIILWFFLLHIKSFQREKIWSFRIHFSFPHSVKSISVMFPFHSLKT